jgi:hypothetical protein
MYDGQIDHMSADGTTVLGNVALGSIAPPAEDEEVWRSFRWQRDRGFEYLSNLNGWPAGAEVAALSGDGTVIAGAHADDRPFIWREPNRVVALGDAPPGFSACFVRRLSNDGSSAVGLCNDSAGLNTAFRWTAETGLSSIGVPGYMVDITRDARVVVGTDTDRQALYRWTAETGTVKLEPPPDWIGTGRYWLEIYEGSLSEDGAAIRGRISTLQAGSNETTARPFLWRQSDGFVGLDPLPGHALSYGFVQARDGSVVAGASSLGRDRDPPDEPVLWDCKGVRDIARELTEAGVDLQGASLSGASYVWVGASIMLAGGASLPGDDRAAWIAWLPNRC